jgi:hypothetical protein
LPADAPTPPRIRTALVSPPEPVFDLGSRLAMDHFAPNLASTHGLAPAPSNALVELISSQELFTRGVRAPHDASGATHASCTWFGVGVSNGSPSRGLPVDVLVMVLAQEMVRRTLGHRRSRILVADTNAMRSGFDELAVRRVAANAERTIGAITRSWGFPVEVFRASTHPAHAEITELARGLGDDHNPYVAEQLAQMELMRREGASIKLGWTLSSSANDEASFDSRFARVFEASPTFVYTIGGRTLDSRRPRACPYLCDDPTTRVLLQRGEDVRAKLADDGPATRGYRRLLGKIARAHGRLVGGLDPRRPEDTVQAIIDRLPEVSSQCRG